MFSTQRISETGTSHAGDELSTTQVCCLWLSCWTQHSRCDQMKLLSGKQHVHSVAMVIFHCSPTIAQVNAWEGFTQFQIWNTPGIEPGTSLTAGECSATELPSIEILNSTKHSVFSCVHIIGAKVSDFDVTMIFPAFLLSLPTQAHQFFSTQRIVLTQGSPWLKINIVPPGYDFRDCHVRHGTVLVLQTSLFRGNQLLRSVTKLIIVLR